jgi:dihydrofolate reductase
LEPGGANETAGAGKNLIQILVFSKKHMRKIIAFTNISVDGFFAGPNGEIDWFKGSDDEEKDFSHAAVNQPATLIFGRTTYEMMAGYWPTPDAVRNDPVIARVMNNSPKIVFSKTMKPVKDGPVWKNVKVLHEINPEEIAKLKTQGGGNMVILGSGMIVQQLANLNLFDEFELMVHPLVLGAGKYLFNGISRMKLKLLTTRTFGSGKVFLSYGSSMT